MNPAPPPNPPPPDPTAIIAAIRLAAQKFWEGGAIVVNPIPDPQAQQPVVQLGAIQNMVSVASGILVAAAQAGIVQPDETVRYALRVNDVMVGYFFVLAEARDAALSRVGAAFGSPAGNLKVEFWKEITKADGSVWKLTAGAP